MAQPKVSDEEFIQLWNSYGGAAEVSRHLRCDIRPVHRRRRRLECSRGITLAGTSPKSPDYGQRDTTPEFPDWQQLEIKNGLLVVFSDSHLVPGIKSTAHRALVQFVHEHKPAAVIDNGDLLDFASISRHHRIGWDGQLDVHKELEWASECLDELKQKSKNSKTLRNMGNHDQRFSGFFSNVSGRMGRVKGTSLQDHLVGWPVSWAIRVNDDQLEVKHRWKSGIHAPHNNTVWAGISYATGHLHSQKVMPITDLRGDRWGVDVGCLSSVYGPHFRYMEAAPRNWRSGFAVFRFVNYKLRQPQLVRVVDEERGIVEYLDKDITV